MAGVQALRRWRPDLDRLAIDVRDGLLYVAPTNVTPGARQPPQGYDVQSGGVLLPPRRD